MNIVAIIPARGGSQRLPRKNLVEVFGKPMIVWAIEACQRTAAIDAVFVSTEDEETGQVARDAGARIIPRPSELSAGHVPKVEVLRHADGWLYETEHCHPHSMMCVQANSPEVLARDLHEAIRMLQQHKLWEVTSVGENNVQNGAFRLIRQHSLYNTFLSAHLGVVATDYLDIHTENDLESLNARYDDGSAFHERVAADRKWASTSQENLDGELATTLDDYAISRELYFWISEHLEPGKTIVEFGSGSGTQEIGKQYRVYSVEHDPKWIGTADNCTYILAPLKNYGNYEWYDREVVQRQLPQDYDLIIVDGPPNSARTAQIGRQGFVDNLNMFRHDVPIVFDDVHRTEEYENMAAVAQQLGRSIQLKRGWQKDFGVVI